MGPGGGGLHVKDLTRGKWFALAGHKNSHALPVGPPGDPVQPPGRTLGLADDAKSIMCIKHRAEACEPRTYAQISPIGRRPRLSCNPTGTFARQICWVSTIEGLDTCILVPCDPADMESFLEAMRSIARPADVDVVIGVRGAAAPSEACNGLAGRDQAAG
jgi:hypothetical protein